MKVRWWFSILLGLTYLAVFSLWRAVSSPWIFISGLGVSACLGALLIVAAKQRCFFNLWDGLFHASVILDILLEATWIKGHEHVGCYHCAAAFAVVLVGYRLWWLRPFTGSQSRATVLSQFGEVTSEPSFASLFRHPLTPFGLRGRLNQSGPFGMALDRNEEDRLRIIYDNCGAMVLKSSNTAHHPLSEIHVRSGGVLNVHF